MPKGGGMPGGGGGMPPGGRERGKLAVMLK